MTTTVEAIYENGTLLLMHPIALPNGTQVQVVVIDNERATSSAKGGTIEYTRPADGKTPAQIMAEIAALPLEGKTDPFSGADHDKVLYG